MNDYLKIKKWVKDNSEQDELLFITKLVKGGLTYSQMCVVLNAMDTTCMYCMNSEEPCYCMRDD